MNIAIFDTKSELGTAAAESGAQAIRSAIARKGTADIILATGASQFEMLQHLVRSPEVDWSRVAVFHLDEYIDLPETHPASFRRFLKERFRNHVSELRELHLIQGDAADIEKERRRLNELIASRSIDAAFVGIGENAHLAFNDPPADFDTEIPYLVVDLDAACRRQQVGEGWFKTVDDVPGRAISMSVRQILKSTVLIVSVPDERKAEAVKCVVEGPVTNTCPASIMQTHPDCRLFLDRPSAKLLTG